MIILYSLSNDLAIVNSLASLLNGCQNGVVAESWCSGDSNKLSIKVGVNILDTINLV